MARCIPACKRLYQVFLKFSANNFIILETLLWFTVFVQQKYLIYGTYLHRCEEQLILLLVKRSAMYPLNTDSKMSSQV